MIFNSLSYLFFLILAIFISYFFKKFRPLIIIFLGVVFYSLWRYEFVFLILFSSYIDFVMAKKIKNSEISYQKNLYSFISISTNILILLIFKYSHFISDSTNFIFKLINYNTELTGLNVILPLGISFYTFEAISYTIDVRRGNYEAENSFINYLSYILFFPKLIAGPILRPNEFLPQLNDYKKNNYSDIVDAIIRIFSGLFLKVVVADNIGILVDNGFELPYELSSAIDNITLGFLFGFQIYFDFSAYSSIAIGSAKLLGISLPENFNFPYSSSNPRDFWKKWHITLSRWVKDYLYKTQISFFSRILKFHEFAPFFALFISWAIMGLWHGPSWNFVFWGIIHALYILIYRFLYNFDIINLKKNKFFKLISVLTFNLLVMIAWIPFRSLSFDEAFYRLSTIFALGDSKYLSFGLRESTYLVCFLMFTLYWINYFIVKMQNKNKYPLIFQIIAWTLYGFIGTPLLIAFLKPNNQFIYFQF